MKKVVKVALVFLILLSVFSCKEDAFLPDIIPVQVDRTLINWTTKTHYTLTRDTQTGKVICPEEPYIQCLEKEKNKDFVILNFSDIQLDPGIVITAGEKKLIKELVRTQKPNLITLTGDQSYGCAIPLKSLCDFIDSLGIPWAPVFGNHDHNQHNISIEKQCALYEQYENCMFKTGPFLGTTNNSNKLGNYVIHIYENTQDGFEVVKSLFFLDSGNKNNYNAADYPGQRRYGTDSWDTLNSQQTDFWKYCMDSVEIYGNNIKSAIFVHIPIHAYLDAMQAAFKTDKDIYNIPAFLLESRLVSFRESLSASVWNEGYEGSIGIMREPYCGSPYEDGIFEKIKDKTDLVICGHDHTNNFVIKYQGVILCYAMKTGYNSYFSPKYTGGTVIHIEENGNLTVNQII